MHFRLFTLGPYSPNRSWVRTWILPKLSLERCAYKIDESVVDVLSAEMRVAIGRQNEESRFSLGFGDAYDGDIESSSAKVINDQEALGVGVRSFGQNGGI